MCDESELNYDEIKAMPEWKLIHEFVLGIVELDYAGILRETQYRFGNYKCEPSIIFEEDDDDAVLWVEEAECSVNEWTDDSEAAAFLSCEGDLYEALYYYEGFGTKDILGKDTEKLYDLLNSLTRKHGLLYSWASGAIIFYKNIEPEEFDDEETEDDE